MRRVFVISDTHFGHTNILKYEPEHRPFDTIEEHDEKLIELWNKRVEPKDIVWHLGDVALKQSALGIVARLNGEKRLVLGNHDVYPMEDYLKYFKVVCGSAAHKGYLLSHMPVHPCQFGRFKGNVHGHMHSKKLDDRRYYNASAENIGLVPMLFDYVDQAMSADYVDVKD